MAARKAEGTLIPANPLNQSELVAISVPRIHFVFYVWMLFPYLGSYGVIKAPLANRPRSYQIAEPEPG